MPAAKGTRPPNAGKGRPKGVPNKVTTSAREAYQRAFEGLGGVESLIAWGLENRSQFYTIHARLIPVEHVGEGGAGPIATVVRHIYETVEPQK